MSHAVGVWAGCEEAGHGASAPWLGAGWRWWGGRGAARSRPASRRGGEHSGAGQREAREGARVFVRKGKVGAEGTKKLLIKKDAKYYVKISAVIAPG